MTIYSVRGANGAGKSTLVRRVLELYPSQDEMRVESRKRPLGYRCSGGDMRPLFVPGSYETPTGGCDTISDVETAYALVKSYADLGLDVLFEGILAQHSSGRLLDLRASHRVEVIVLTTSEEDCVAAVRDRRAARGATVEEFDPRNVIKEYKSVQSSSRALSSKGCSVSRLSREEAFEYLRDQLCGKPVADAASAGNDETNPVGSS
jgi:hypothetical protein